MRRRRTALASALVLGAALACSGSTAPVPTASPRPMRWAAVELPDGAAPLLVGAGDGVVLVATRTGQRASMYQVAVPGPVAPVPVRLAPHSVYAAGARWVGLAIDGARVVAFGRASGGAHGLPRWTVWDGTTGSLAERPQPFETFGGPRSGGLAAVGLGREAVLVGTWDDGGPGLDARVWTRASPSAWVRRPVTPALASTDRDLPQPAAVFASATHLVVVGSVTELAGSTVATRAVAWSAPGSDGPWTRQDLPTTTSSARATGVVCVREACWVVGVDGEAPAAWKVAASGTVTAVPLPPVPTTQDVPPAVALAGASPWIAVAGRDHVVLFRPESRGGGPLEGPPGLPVSLAASPGRLDLVTRTGGGTRLWTTRTD